MPSKPRRPRAEKPATNNGDEIDKELAAAEADAATPIEADGGNGEEAAGEETATAVEEAPEPQARTSRRRGATLRVAASGNADEVRESLAKFGQGGGAEEEPEEEIEEEEEVEEVSQEDRFAKIISSPKVFVTVIRQMPRHHNTLRVPSHLPDARYDCPASFEKIKQEIFQRFGGEVFLFQAHPRKPNGENTILAAITVHNHESDIPLIEGEEIGALAIEPTEETAEIPMAVEDNDPLRKIEAAIADQARVSATFSRLKMSKKLMKEMNREDDEPKLEPQRPVADPEIAILKKQIADRDAEQRMEKRQAAFEDRIMAAVEAMSTNKKGGSDNALMIAMMQSADAKFTTLMTTLLPAIVGQNKKTDDLDMQLGRLAKLREVLGGDNSKVKSIEARIMEKMMDRFLDGDEGGGSAAGGDVADVAKTALKELAPIAKSFVDSKVGNAPANIGPTQDDFKRAVAQEAMRISQSASFQEALTNDLKKRGLLIKVPPPAPALPAPAPKGPQAQAAKPAPVKEPEKGEEEVVDGDEIDPPANPQSPDYDRKAAVNFVLDTFIREMPTQREDGFAVGDVLDRLDEDLLKGLLDVSDAEGLQKLIGADADPVKLEAITNAARSDGKIKNWLSRIILSAQAAYRNALDESREKTVKEASAAEGAEAGG